MEGCGEGEGKEEGERRKEGGEGTNHDMAFHIASTSRPRSDEALSSSEK